MTYTSRQVSIPSGDAHMAGLLCSPVGAEGATPAFAIIGPIGFVKEQSPMQLAYLAFEIFISLMSSCQ